MILVFVGAGGSAAVDPKQYPTTVGFFESLPNEIKDNSLFLQVCNFLKGQKNKERIDIEDVLETLDELRADCKKITDPTTMIGWTLVEDAGLIRGVPFMQASLDSITELEMEGIVPLSNKIKDQVYKFYAATPDPNKLSAWIRLIKGLEKIDPALEIFTTNYDRVLENVIREAGIDMEMGRKFNGIQTRLDTSPWGTPDGALTKLHGSCGRLTKLHGSVDWQHSNEGINISEVFTGDHQNHCILYPGYKGEPTEDPFRTFHTHLRKVVNEKYAPLSAAVFIGFAFRDDSINRVFSDLPPETPTCFITKSDITPLPPETRPPRAPLIEEKKFRHLCGGLTAETVAECLAAISAATGRPLDS